MKKETCGGGKVAIGGSGEVDEITNDESVATPRHWDIIIPWVHS